MSQFNPRPDRQRKKKKTDPNVRTNPMTGQRERSGGGINMPDPFGSTPQFVTGKGPAGFDPMGDIQRQQKQVDQVKLNRDLRSQLASKQTRGRKQTAMQSANTRRQTRTFRDPANLQRYLSNQATGPTTTRGSQQPEDMDDTIVKSGGQNYRYDAEIDAFTPVNFDPAKNRFVFAGEDEAAAAKAQSGSVEDSMKVAQRAFDKQMGELRGLADKDQQFGDMYQEMQSEYMSILRDPDLRPEERNSALQDLFDRGASTFELTSGFARAAKDQEAMQKQQEAKSKMDEDMQYRHRRALEAKDEIRKKQEDARYEDRKTRQKFSETTQTIDKAYEAYKAPLEAKKNSLLGQVGFGDEIEIMSLEDFTNKYYERMHQDREIQDAVREIDGQMSIIETEIGQLENEDDLSYRNQLTSVYGAGRQDAADAAFQDHLNQKEARIVRKRRQLNALREQKTMTLDRVTVGEKLRDAEQAATLRTRMNVAELESRDAERNAGDIGFFNRMRVIGERDQEVNRTTDETRQLERRTQATLARGRMERDSEGKLKSNSPAYVAEQVGDPTLKSKIQRLAAARRDPEKFGKRYFGRNERGAQVDDIALARQEAENEVFDSIEQMVIKEQPDIAPDGEEMRDLVYERIQQMYDFEDSLFKEQVGDR